LALQQLEKPVTVEGINRAGVKNMSFRILKNVPILQARFAEYQKWVNLSPEAKQNLYATKTVEADRAKHARTDGYVAAFNTPNNTLLYLKTRILAPTQSGAGSNVANVCRGLVDGPTMTAAEFAALTNPASVTGRKYPFAKLALTSVSVNTTPATSRITSAKYRKPDVDTASSPFGQKTGGQDYNAAVTEIRALSAFSTFVNQNDGKNRAKFTPEG
jgi:hypothetical protein